MSRVSQADICSHLLHLVGWLVGRLVVLCVLFFCRRDGIDADLPNWYSRLSFTIGWLFCARRVSLVQEKALVESHTHWRHRVKGGGGAGLVAFWLLVGWLVGCVSSAPSLHTMYFFFFPYFLVFYYFFCVSLSFSVCRR